MTEELDILTRLREHVLHFIGLCMPETRQLLLDAAAEIDRLRKKQTEMNRRCQSAEKAIADANRTIDEICKNNETGTPWAGGNFGRALLAYGCARMDEEITALKSENEQLRATIAGLRGENVKGP